MAYTDNYETLKESVRQIDERNKLVIRLERQKQTDELQVNMRVFTKTEKYSGPTKMGIIMKVYDEEEIEEIKEFFMKTFDSFIK